MAIYFINMDPCNDFFRSAFTVEQSKKINPCCIVTFDQPLFLKNSEIIEGADNSSNVSKIILRLCGFHILMSYMGLIGCIIKRSGIENLW